MKISDIILLVKQVPDISRLPENAFDPKTGNILRSKLAPVVNPFDIDALAIALQIKKHSPCAKIICLSMGPPLAQQALRFCLQRRADTGILLTDKNFAGSDTWATAKTLSLAVRKIKSEMTESDNLLILSGMQSNDGDTAQVPAQLAAALDIPCVPYVTDLKFEDDQPHFESVTDNGSLIIQPASLPAVITVANTGRVPFADFASCRKAIHSQIIKWDADSIGAKHTGTADSKTTVVRVFSPERSSRTCKKIHTPAEFAEKLLEIAKSENKSLQDISKQAEYILPSKRPEVFDRNYEAIEKHNENYNLLKDILCELKTCDPANITAEQKERITDMSENTFHGAMLNKMLAGYGKVSAAYNGPVAVYVPVKNGKPEQAGLELLTAGQKLAKSLGQKVIAMVTGKNLAGALEIISRYCPDVIARIEHRLLESPEPNFHKAALLGAIKQLKPQIVLLPATAPVRVLAPMVAYCLDCGLTADCTRLEIRDMSIHSQFAILAQTRPALGGNIMATICTRDSPVQMATVRPGVFTAQQQNSNSSPEIIEIVPELSESQASWIIKKNKVLQSQEISLDAEIIISGGKGMQSKDRYESMVNSLAKAIGRVSDLNVTTGASRAAVEHGFALRNRQIGQTGTAVKPKIYLATAISGAVQHMVGVGNSQYIMAINSDPAASIFSACDYYLNEKVEVAVPEIIETLEAKK